MFCIGGGHTGGGEKHVCGEVRGGGKLGVDGPVEEPEEWTFEDG